MRVAITADLHLTDPEIHPERFEVFRFLLEELTRQGIRSLIIAGDLFDASGGSYAPFESLCHKRDLEMVILPGNHDARLHEGSFTLSRLHVIDEPVVHQFDLMSLPVLLVPYRVGMRMGEAIADFAESLPQDRWILIGHGDWITGLREPNPYEPGMYMPLGRRDVEKYRPRRVILGHIHKPSDAHPVAYCGSPCPLDQSETGRRRYLILDTETGEVTSHTIHAGPIYFEETCLVLPPGNAEERLRHEIHRRLTALKLSEEEKSRVRLRLYVRGLTEDRRVIKAAAEDACRTFGVGGVTIDLSDLFEADDTDRAEIARLLPEAVSSLSYRFGSEDPDREQILFSALKTLYEVS